MQWNKFEHLWTCSVIQFFGMVGLSGLLKTGRFPFIYSPDLLQRMRSNYLTSFYFGEVFQLTAGETVVLEKREDGVEQDALVGANGPVAA